MAPRWTTTALEDLRAAGDSAVMAEILDIGNRELRPDADDLIEGDLDDGSGRFRRCVRLSELANYSQYHLDDVDEFDTPQPWNYTLTYREVTTDERIDRQWPSGWVIVKVTPDEDLYKRYISAIRFGS